VQWRAHKDDVPEGSEVKVRVVDKKGESVLSGATTVLAQGQSLSSSSSGFSSGETDEHGDNHGYVGGAGAQPGGSSNSDDDDSASSGKFTAMTDPLKSNGHEDGMTSVPMGTYGDGELTGGGATDYNQLGSVPLSLSPWLALGTDSRNGFH